MLPEKKIQKRFSFSFSNLNNLDDRTISFCVLIDDCVSLTEEVRKWRNLRIRFKEEREEEVRSDFILINLDILEFMSHGFDHSSLNSSVSGKLSGAIVTH